MHLLVWEDECESSPYPQGRQTDYRLLTPTFIPSTQQIKLNNFTNFPFNYAIHINFLWSLLVPRQIRIMWLHSCIMKSVYHIYLQTNCKDKKDPIYCMTTESVYLGSVVYLCWRYWGFYNWSLDSSSWRRACEVSRQNIQSFTSPYCGLEDRKRDPLVHVRLRPYCKTLLSMIWKRHFNLNSFRLKLFLTSGFGAGNFSSCSLLNL